MPWKKEINSMDNLVQCVLCSQINDNLWNNWSPDTFLDPLEKATQPGIGLSA